jgi:hypothetical protein
MEARLKREHKEIPIFMEEELACKHYSGFSSKFAHIVTKALEIDPYCQDLGPGEAAGP